MPAVLAPSFKDAEKGLQVTRIAKSYDITPIFVQPSFQAHWIVPEWSCSPFGSRILLFFPDTYTAESIESVHVFAWHACRRAQGFVALIPAPSPGRVHAHTGVAWYRWLIEQRHVRPHNLILCGERRGAVTALKVSTLISQGNLPNPAGVVLFRPVLHDLFGPAFENVGNMDRRSVVDVDLSHIARTLVVGDSCEGRTVNEIEGSVTGGGVVLRSKAPLESDSDDAMYTRAATFMREAVITAAARLYSTLPVAPLPISCALMNDLALSIPLDVRWSHVS